MSDHAAFTAAVLAAPDDDLPRLIYADWLDEHGDPRGEFIRLQIAQVRGNSAAADAARIAELNQRHGRIWAGEADRWALVWEFRRGFIERLILNASEFVDQAEKMFASFPVRQVTLIGAASRAAALAQLPELGRINALHLTGCGLGDVGLIKLLHTPCLDRVRTLRLGDNDLSDYGVEALARCRWLRNLEDLDLSHNEVGDAGTRALFKSVFFHKLRRLILVGNVISDAGVSFLRLNAQSRGVEVMHDTQRVRARCRLPR